MRLPQLYETTVVLPYLETSAGKKVTISEIPTYGGVSREEIAHDRIARQNPEAAEYSIRLMRPDEIRAAMPLEERIRWNIVQSVLTAIHFHAATDKYRKEIDN